MNASCAHGVFGVSWAELLIEAVAKVGVKHKRMRRSLPAGFAQPGFDRESSRAEFEELTKLVLAEVDFDSALGHFADDLVSSRHSLLHGQLEQIMRLGELNAKTSAGARANLLYHLHHDDEHVYISCYGGQMQLPIHARQALEYALTHDRFLIQDLPGELDDAGHIVLIDRLIREGLVVQH